MATTEFDTDAFIEAYVESHAWKDKRDPETCRENAKKYAVSLRGTDSRLGWFEWLQDERDKAAAEAEPADVRAFLTYLTEQGLSSSTRSQARSGVSQYYQLLGSGENPVEGLEGSWSVTTDKEQATGKERVYLSEEEVAAMVENVPTPTLRSELIVRLLYETGVRRMELATIEIAQVDREAREIQVYADKTDEWRTVSFSNSLREPLSVWIEGPRKDEPGWHEDNPYLFPSLRNRETDTDHISGETIRKTVIEAAESAGLQESYGTDSQGQTQNTITPHVLRHTFAVHAAENGVPAPHLQTILGHHSLDITQIYASIAEEDAVAVMKDRGPSL